MNFDKAEELLLAKLSTGLLDGPVGEERIYRNYSKVYCGMYILDGIPVFYREGISVQPSGDVAHSSDRGNRQEEHYDTDEKKLLFLQKYGWLINLR